MTQNRKIELNFRDACARIHELSEFVLELKKAEFDHAPKLAAYGPYSHDFIELRQITKSDYELFQTWKSLLRDFNL